MPIYEWKRVTLIDEADERWEYTTTMGPINDPVPVPEGDGWKRVYSYQVGKVSGVGDSPSRSVKSQ